MVGSIRTSEALPPDSATRFNDPREKSVCIMNLS